MADQVDSTSVDVQSLSDTALEIYEAIATLEFSGQRASYRNISSAIGRGQPSLSDELAEMARRGLLQIKDDKADDGPLYIPAQRGWSAAPEQAEGHHSRGSFGRRGDHG